ncbi:MAG: Ger(x)C family spore germination C-terminal domain-containing protein, partial [Negativibacillus sp.]
KATVRHTIDKVLFENKSDVFRYSEFIRKYLPDYWKENQQRWKQVIDDCTVDISVDCVIEHPGLETGHRHA